MTRIEKTPKNLGGRPTKYKPEYCSMLIEHMEKGFSYNSFSGIIDIHRSILYEWENKYPEFLEAKNIGFAKCLLFWEKIGIKGTVGYLPGFNATSYNINMKNRFAWKDKIENEVKGNINIHNSEELVKHIYGHLGIKD